MRTIAPEELKASLEAGEPVEVVDIREIQEYAGWHILGSRNLPVYDDLKADREDSLRREGPRLPRDRRIVTVCRGGFISEKAARVLEELGYDAHSLEGGMRGWGGVWSEAPIAPTAGATLVQVRRNGKGCLSYVLGQAGQAVVLDPSVEIEAYLETARRAGLRITHVLETHVHADHLSRARALCAATGAELYMPENRRVDFAYHPVRHGDRLVLGGLGVEAIATPGHTSESTCYLVEDEWLFTGDTLFVDAVGRPDLERGDAGAEDGARQLFRSLTTRLLGRPGSLRFFPCHYAGAIGFDRSPVGSTLETVRRRLELAGQDETSFVRRVLSTLKDKPGNYDSIIAINEGKAALEDGTALELEAGPNSCAAG